MSSPVSDHFRDDELKAVIEEVNGAKNVPKCIKKVLATLADQLSSLATALE